MNKKTNDKTEVNSAKNINSFSTEKELEDAKIRLEYYREEYRWVTCDKPLEEKIKEVIDEAKKIRPMINGEISKEQRYYQQYYNILIHKKAMMEDGSYTALLRDNILSIMVPIMQYEIDKTDYTVSSIIKAAFKGNRDYLKGWSKNLKTERFLSKLKFNNIPKEKPLVLQSPDELLSYIDRHYDLVGLQIPKEKNVALSVSEGYFTKTQRDMFDMVESYLQMGKIPKDVSEVILFGQRDSNENSETSEFPKNENL